MRKLLFVSAITLLVHRGVAQVGIGTVNPNSTLDVRGSLALNLRQFSGDITLGATDNHLVFNGSSAATVTLPDAALCPGRAYAVKHAGSGYPFPVVRVVAAGGQLIDDSAALALSYSGESLILISNGTAWTTFAHTIPAASGLHWATDGNSLNAEKMLGTQTNHDLPFITNATEKMRLTATGRLGLGINKPITEMHLFSAATPSGITSSYIKGITITGNGSYGFGGPGFYLENRDNPVNKRLFKINFTANGGSESYINFQSVTDNGANNINANILTVSHGGRVGVGTATFNSLNPEKLLVDAGSTVSYNVISAKGSMNQNLQFNIQNVNSGSAASTSILALANNGDQSSNHVRLGINGSGNTAADLLGGANTAYLVATGNHFAIGNGSSGKDILFFTGGTASQQERMRISATGVSPGADNLYSLGSSAQRWTALWSVNGVIQTSDLRLKKDVQNLNYGLQQLLDLRPVSYQWIQGPAQRQIGLIAQEVQQVIPEVVTGSADSGTMGMNYAALVPVLIAAIKELKTEVDALKKQIAGSAGVQ